METETVYDLNRVTLVGRLTRDPELRALPSGSSVCSLRIATNSSHRDSATGERSDRPNFFDVSVYGPPGESVGTYMRRGSRVAIDGRLHWREWDNQDDERRQAVSIIADSVQFLDRPDERDRDEPDDGALAGVAAGGQEDDERL
jgi:single-strand DNA-binding protein